MVFIMEPALACQSETQSHSQRGEGKRESLQSVNVPLCVCAERLITATEIDTDHCLLTNDHNNWLLTTTSTNWICTTRTVLIVWSQNGGSVTVHAYLQIMAQARLTLSLN